MFHGKDLYYEQKHQQHILWRKHCLQDKLSTVETATKNHIWSKEDKVAGNNKIYHCVPISLTALGVFRTPQKAMVHLNNAAR